MAVVDAGGSASGVGTITGEGSLIISGWDASEGASAVFAIPGVRVLVSAAVVGRGTLSWATLRDESGLVECRAVVAGSGVRSRDAHGLVAGQARISLAAPWLVVGASSVQAYGDVQRHLRALQPAPCLKAFRYLQEFQPGDLALYLTRAGEPVDGSAVYTLYRVRDGGRDRVGPARRAPARGGLGEFYATGLAGEGGQPGTWVIVWEYGSGSTEMEFRVLDSTGVPAGLSGRCRKYGWT